MQMSRMSDGKSKIPMTSGPPAGWWWLQAIAALAVAMPMLAWGVATLMVGHSLPMFLAGHHSRANAIQFDGAAARLFGFALVVGAPGVFAHMFLTCFERLEWIASSLAKLAGELFLVLFIAAVVRRLI